MEPFLLFLRKSKGLLLSLVTTHSGSLLLDEFSEPPSLAALPSVTVTFSQGLPPHLATMTTIPSSSVPPAPTDMQRLCVTDSPNGAG